MTFGQDLGWGTSPGESKAIMSAYLDLGGNSVDTANIYTNGHAEAIIGEYLACHPGTRDRIVLGTKFFWNRTPAIRTAAAPAARASSGSWRTRCAGCGPTTSTSTGCTTSIRRLPPEETLRALDDLVRAGKIRYTGFSDTPGAR